MSRDALIEKFKNVGLDRIEEMNSLLVELERNPEDEEGVDELMREMHTIKGEAKMMGFADINLVAHQTEELLLEIVEDGVITDTEPIDLVFEGLDLMRDLLAKSGADPSADLDLNEFIDQIAAYRSGEKTDGGDTEQTDPAPDEDDAEPEPASSEPEQHTDRPPEADDTDDEPGDDQPETREPADTSTHTRIDTDQDRSGSDGDPDSLRIETSSSLRVDVDKLERLGDIAGEALLMSRRLEYELDELGEIRDQFRRLMDDLEDHLPQSRVRDLRDAIHRLDSTETSIRDENYQVNRRASQLDDHARTLRHVPLSQVLSHYPRAVRDLADSQGKDVRLVHTFGNVEVDRTILDALSEPLLHLVRNAVDHGIEPPEQRAEAGKDPEGEISLTAEYFGDAIRVELADDGRGIDPDAVRDKAVERNHLSPDKAQRLSDQEAIALVFEPGFSTSTEVSDVSGRGVGMDVVRRQVTEIGGFIEVESEVGEGTTFTLHIPVSSAVNSVLLFVIGSRNFALSSKDVERVAMVDRDQLEEVHGGVCVRRDDGELLPLVDWTGLLDLADRGDPPDRMTVLLVRKGARRVAVWVDDVIGEREAISRPLDDFLKGVGLCRGIALTDSGAVVPLLNVVQLMERTSGDTRLELADHPSSPVEESVSRESSPGDERSFTAVQGHQAANSQASTILVVEDSEVTRSLVVGMLEDRDYRVLEADDGHHAWQRLDRHNVDLVLTDIQMPRMNGLELLENIRSSPQYENLPVVILTTLDDPEDKKDAMQRGANGYLVKLSFEEKELLETVERYIG